MRYLLDTNILSNIAQPAPSESLIVARGRPRSALDAIIAAVAEANACIVVTDNERDFAGIEIVNPLRGGT